ncbi:MAG: tetraacyldisaccharide 4'-kinase [Bacteroidales bacterium]|nr:tetraacyldisaccharide 4'-kinase [Bacteroidales bacterium]
MNSDKILLAPYYWALRVRHFCYDKGWKKVQKAPVLTVCVGNIAVGGTGKTPFTELLLRLLGTGDMIPLYADLPARVGVLSKGYGRKSKGFFYVETDGTPEQYGDEPLQIKRKFPQVPVAVCSSRIEGCQKMAEDGCGLILLDDAFQHRALQADCNIVLIEYGRPLRKDHLLPRGRLRDIPERIAAADIIIASKCPDDLTAEERSIWLEGLRLPQAYDASALPTESPASSTESPATATPAADTRIPVFFSMTEYNEMQGLYAEADRHYLYSRKVILISGIANDRPLMGLLSERYRIAGHLSFPDHHAFTDADLRRMEAVAAEHPEALLVTTEKDCQRLLPLRERFSEGVRQRLFYQPIQARFLTHEETDRFPEMLYAALKRQ